MPSDYKDWWQNSKAEWPLVARVTIEHLREREQSAREDLERLERELNEARAALASEIALPTHLLDVQAIADERDSLRAINAGLKSAIRSFQNDFERIQWGYDGDCGSSRLAEDLFDSLTETAREVIPVKWEPWTVEMVRNHKNFQETADLHNAEMERVTK